jgi:hypothetical protein
MDEKIERIIRQEFTALAKKKYEAVDAIDVEEIDFNPFLLRVLGFETAEEIAEFIVAERLERSLVTSYGTRIQKIAKEISGRGTGVEGADICKELEGRRHYIQLKAGPNTVNKDISSEINKLLSGALRRNHGSVALLGMTYGKRRRVSSIIQRYSNVNWLIGREFWGFISEDKDCAQKIFDIAGELNAVVPDGGLPFRERYENKIDALAEQIRNKYGEGHAMWQKLFDDNM